MADPATTSAITTLISALLGFLTSSISERFRDRRTVEREREARAAARQVQLLERRANFQRETLLALQDAVVKLTRATGKMHHFDRMEHRKTGQWGGNLFPEGLSDEAHAANVAIMVLTSRVRDAQIRDLAQAFRDRANFAQGAHSEEANAEAMAGMIEQLDRLHQRVGEALRQLDQDEDAQSGAP